MPLLESHPEAPYYTMEDLTHHIAFLVCPDIWKKTEGMKPYIPQFKAFHNTIYKYSSKWVDVLLEDEVFTSLFRYYIKSGSFLRFIKNDPTLLTNESLFIKSADEIMERIAIGNSRSQKEI